MNAVEIEQAVTALAEQPFDRAEFPFAFLEAFGNKETTIKRLRSGASMPASLTRRNFSLESSTANALPLA